MRAVAAVVAAALLLVARSNGCGTTLASRSTPLGAVLSTDTLCIAISVDGTVVDIVQLDTNVSFLSRGPSVAFMALSFTSPGPSPPSSTFTLSLVSVAQPAGVNSDIVAVFKREGRSTTVFDQATRDMLPPQSDTLQVTLNVSTAPLHGSESTVVMLSCGAIICSAGLDPVERFSLQFTRLGLELEVVADNLVAAYTNATDARDFAVALVPIDLPVLVAATSSAGMPKLTAELPLSLRSTGEGSRLAMWGGPPRAVLTAVQAIESTFGLPHATIDGVFSKSSNVTKLGQSYRVAPPRSRAFTTNTTCTRSRSRTRTRTHTHTRTRMFACSMFL
jgi:hypothetical protein